MVSYKLRFRGVLFFSCCVAAFCCFKLLYFTNWWQPVSCILRVLRVLFMATLENVGFLVVRALEKSRPQIRIRDTTVYATQSLHPSRKRKIVLDSSVFMISFALTTSHFPSLLSQKITSPQTPFSQSKQAFLSTSITITSGYQNWRTALNECTSILKHL